MNASLANGQPIANKAFEEALERHRRQWKGDERMFSPSSLEDIVAGVEGIGENQRKGLVGRFSSRLGEVVKGFEVYFGAVDAFISSNQIAGLVWGAIRFVIKLALIHGDYLEKVFTILEAISGELHCYHQYANAMFGESQRVMTALVNVYDGILTVLMKIKEKFVDDQGRERGAPAVAVHLLNPLQESFDDIAGGFKKKTETLEQEVKLEVRQRDEMERQRRQMRDLRQRLEFQDSSLSAHQDAKDKVSPKKVEEVWLLRQKSYHDWCENNSADGTAGLLWIYGMPGSGKTILASIVIEHMINRLKPNSAVTYFYCDYKGGSNANPANILRGLLDQLLEGLKPPFHSSIQTILNDYSTTRLSSDLVVEIIGMVSKQYQDITFVVDALDECQKRGDSESGIFPLLRQLSKFVRLLITSRYERVINDSLGTYAKHTIHLAPREDIENYVSTALEKHFRDSTWMTQDLREDTIKALVLNANGMFLCARFQLEDVQQCEIKSEVQKILKTLPRGLDETFVRSLKTIDNLSDVVKVRTQSALRWVICTGSISLPDLLTLLSVEDMTNSWDENNVFTDGYSVIDRCAQLVSLAPGDPPRVVPTHNSVYKFLTSDPMLTRPTPSLPDYHIFPSSCAYKMCGQALNKYLNLCPSPEVVRFVFHVVGQWLLKDVYFPELWSLSFAAPEFQQPTPGVPTFPNVKRVKAINCSFLWAENVFSVFPTGLTQDRLSYGALGFDDIFPNAEFLELDNVSCTETETVLTMCEDPGDPHITPYPNNDSTCATVVGMRFIQASESCWEIYPGSSMFLNESRKPSIGVAELVISSSTLCEHQSPPKDGDRAKANAGLFQAASEVTMNPGISLDCPTTEAFIFKENLGSGGKFTNYCRLRHIPGRRL